MSIFTAILINNYNHPSPSCIFYVQITKENTENKSQRTKHLLVKLNSVNASVTIPFSFGCESFIFQINKYSLIVLSCMRIYNMSTILGSLYIFSIALMSHYVYHMVGSARKFPREKPYYLFEKGTQSNMYQIWIHELVVGLRNKKIGRGSQWSEDQCSWDRESGQVFGQNKGK